MERGGSFFVRLVEQPGPLKFLFPSILLSSEYIFLCALNVVDYFMVYAIILGCFIISLLIPQCKGFPVGSILLVSLMELLHFTYNPHFLDGIFEKNVLIP